MSYYTHYVIQCDQLTFDRMIEAWKQRGWWGRCTLCRPDYLWSASRDCGDGTKTDTYLVSAMMNHGPRSDEVEEFLELADRREYGQRTADDGCNDAAYAGVEAFAHRFG